MADLLYREYYGKDWVPVDIVGWHESGRLIVRESDKSLPGVMLASMFQLRQPVGKAA